MSSDNHATELALQVELPRGRDAAAQGPVPAEVAAAGAPMRHRGLGNPRASEIPACLVDNCTRSLNTRYEAVSSLWGSLGFVPSPPLLAT